MNSAQYRVQQFEDKPMSHYSYAVMSQSQIVLIDPARDIRPYIAYASEHRAKIIAVIETHPHADFVSGHLELYQQHDATIYCSRKLGATYAFVGFDDGDHFSCGDISLKAINTPGHSPDSICIILENNGRDEIIFTGDTLFIGDCGRPDLRENVGNITADRIQLARMMYYSLRDKILKLPDNILIYPTHGAGSLCGKALSNANSSTLAAEKISNWSLQNISEENFITELISGQGNIPQYFAYNVELNKQGADTINSSIKSIPIIDAPQLDKINHQELIVDTRPQSQFKKNHQTNNYNIMIGGKFETWLGSIIAPDERFHLIVEHVSMIEDILYRIAKIGYELNIISVSYGSTGTQVSDALDIEDFNANIESYTIVDVRNASEVETRKIFHNALAIPLAELRNNIQNIPLDKPILVHCAGGYRSAAGMSIIKAKFPDAIVYDLGEAILKY